MSILPQNWIMANFGTVCGNGQYGWTTRASDKGSIKFLRTTDITKDEIDWNSVPYCLEVPTDLEKYQVQPNDILISRAGSVGFSTLISQIPSPTIFASYLIRFVPSTYVEPRYVAYFLRSSEYWEQIAEASSGIALSNVNAKKLSEISIPLAPLNEQKRIADKLDSLLTRVEACRDKLTHVSNILKRIRQSIFNSASSGNLTKNWAYASHHDAWQESLVGDLLVEKPRNGYSPRAVEFETETRSLTLTATTSGRFNPKHIKYIDEKIPENSYLWLEPDDILIQRANTLDYVGVSAIYDDHPKRYIYPDLMMKCRANSRVLTKFLYYLLSSDDVRSYFRKNATGTTGNMPKINQQTVISAPVLVPSIDEQQEIVRRADELFAYVDNAEAYYRIVCTKVEQLTSAILSKAFCGELVLQNIDDEPALELLERIQKLSTSETNISKQQRKPVVADKFSQPKPKILMLKRKNIQSSHLSNILKIRGAMSAETLWSASELDIDDFYDQLKDEEANGLLREIIQKSLNSPRLLEAV